MSHSLEWSRAYTARLSEDDAAACEARSAELAQRLARETAAGELPFLSMPYRAKLEVEMAPLIPRIKAYKHMLVLGIGGSALGPIAIQQALNHLHYNELPAEKRGGPRLYVEDNIDPERMAALLTDGIRAKLLENAGYETQILEFIDMEHTPKNLLIRAVKRQEGSKKLPEELKACMEAYHVKPTLADLLTEKEEP